MDSFQDAFQKEGFSGCFDLHGRNGLFFMAS